MAAMAPALTDASAEAHRIRFKLAPPSSTLSPTSGVEGSVASSNGAVKRKTSEERPAPPHPRGAGSCKRAETGEAETPPTTTPLGKLQPIVTSYRFSDVTSAKESLVLLRGRNILPGLLPHKHQTLELSEEQFKSIMSGGGNGGLCGPSPLQSGVGVAVNGVSKKFPKPGSERDNGVTLNGGSHVGQDSLFQNRTGSPALTGNGPRRGVAAERRQYPRGTSQDGGSNREAPSPFATSASELEEEKITERTLQFCRDASSPSGLGTELRDRTQQSCSRQGEIEGRLRRLRKRLQVVQAKQVERHSQQQLGGLVDSTLGRGAGTLTPQERDRLGRFLKGGSVPAELERLSVSCITNLRSAENAFDSDATESSSGGETDVEEDEIARADVDQRHIPLWRRAEGRYAVDRAAIISHWNWLQAHVSDLEYRIRQQTDIYRQIRACKGFVMLGESSVCESVRDDCGVSRTQSIVSPITQVRDADEMDGSFSGHGIPTETTLRKGCAPVRQVNGVIGSLRASAVDSADPDQQQQQQRVCPAVPSGPDSSCVSARTRPLLSCKRRRLLRPGNSSAAFSSNLNRKVQKLVGSRCGCDVSEQCMMCCGRSSSLSSSSSSSSSSSLAPAEPQYQLPLLDRLAHFDPCVHPILSFPDDVGVSLHLQRVMKCHWQGRPLEKIKPIKKLSLKHKLATSSRLPDPSSSSSSKDKHRLTNSLHTPVRFSHYRIRSEKLFRQQQQQQQHHHHHHQQQQHQQQQGDGESRSYHRPERSHIPYEKSHSRKRPREHSLERVDNAPKMYTEVSSPCPSLSGLSTPTHSPLVRQMSTSESPTPFSINNTTPAPIRRRRGESSFDINNIVIPMSVAATTRVEKLQYKEILTPSWRVVDITAKKISTEDDCVEIEDLSDGVFAQLHLPYEEQEHSRWSWTPSAIAKRRGSRSFKSVDGRTTPLLGGTTPSTPQPSSPDTAHFHLLQDYSSAASPTSPTSPEMLTLSGMHTPGPRDAQRLLSNEDTRCSTPDTIYEEMVSQPVQPWERRNFPLEQDPPLESKEQSSPAPERPFRTMRRISGCKTGSSRSESDAGPPSPSPLPEDSSKQKPSTPKPTHR